MTAADCLLLDVQIFDTDCYGVMWHGAYTKWLEMARVAYLKRRGVLLSKPGEPDGLVYPVVAQQFAFRSPARMADVLALETTLAIEGRKLLFSQTFRQQDTGRAPEAPPIAAPSRVVMEALTTCVILDSRWKPLRRLPDDLLEKLTAPPPVA
ncbi:MAG: hypothetical protein IPK79_06805 [Vampirovibrionales bacterium]|nr:hypothetical protein [Vampirovibrionales bacterium]